MRNQIKKKLDENHNRIEQWFEGYKQKLGTPLYASFDLRDSRDKVAVVDSNIYPAGFNNLCPKYFKQIPGFFRQYLEETWPGVKNILIFPELHTRNHYYMENLRCLSDSLQQAGYHVRVGIVDSELREDRVQRKGMEGELFLDRLVRKNGILAGPDGFEPDLIISNNDFSQGVPEILEGLSTPVVPSTRMGWHLRRKHRHFNILHELLMEFAEVAGIDPWCISSRFEVCEDADFDDEKKRDLLAVKVDTLLEKIQKDYDERGIPDEPFVFIKNNAGTYGIAVMLVRSGDDVINATHKTRTKMRTGKGKTRVNQVLLQEGIPTRDQLDGSPMEPVIYTVGDRPVGGFYRLHRKRSEFQNLNVRGMEFRRMCFHQAETPAPEALEEGCRDAADLLSVYGTLARLACLALAREEKEMNS
ncbi:MAG: glutamate--cysteine ligase [bacterium]